MYFRYFTIISPWKRADPLFEQTWIPLTQGCFVPSLVEIGPVVLEKKTKMWKVYRQTDRQTTDDRWSEKLTWAFSSGELKTKTHNQRPHLKVCHFAVLIFPAHCLYYFGSTSLEYVMRHLDFYVLREGLSIRIYDFRVGFWFNEFLLSGKSILEGFFLLEIASVSVLKILLHNKRHDCYCEIVNKKPTDQIARLRNSSYQ